MHDMNTRVVVLLCGPPGAGKTTIAQASGLEVFDRDDSRWTSEREFVAAIRRLRADSSARAVVIRAGASSSARARWCREVGATHCFMVMVPPDECVRRVRARRREDFRAGVMSVPAWFSRFDDADGVQLFPGWGVLDDWALPVGRASRRW